VVAVLDTNEAKVTQIVISPSIMVMKHFYHSLLDPACPSVSAENDCKPP
jgi:hypothetical protein